MIATANQLAPCRQTDRQAGRLAGKQEGRQTGTLKPLGHVFSRQTWQTLAVSFRTISWHHKLEARQAYQQAGTWTGRQPDRCARMQPHKQAAGSNLPRTRFPLLALATLMQRVRQLGGSSSTLQAAGGQQQYTAGSSTAAGPPPAVYCCLLAFSTTCVCRTAPPAATRCSLHSNDTPTLLHVCVSMHATYVHTYMQLHDDACLRD